jgi:ankyrin repeat protein
MLNALSGNRTALYSAIKWGNDTVEEIHILVKGGANINKGQASSYEINTPLARALKSGHYAQAAALISYGAKLVTGSKNNYAKGALSGRNYKLLFELQRAYYGCPPQDFASLKTVLLAVKANVDEEAAAALAPALRPRLHLLNGLQESQVPGLIGAFLGVSFVSTNVYLLRAIRQMKAASAASSSDEGESS